MSAGIKKITVGILTGILTRMPVKMPAVILMSGAAALGGHPGGELYGDIPSFEQIIISSHRALFKYPMAVLNFNRSHNHNQHCTITYSTSISKIC